MDLKSPEARAGRLSRILKVALAMVAGIVLLGLAVGAYRLGQFEGQLGKCGCDLFAPGLEWDFTLILGILLTLCLGGFGLLLLRERARPIGIFLLLVVATAWISFFAGNVFSSAISPDLGARWTLNHVDWTI